MRTSLVSPCAPMRSPTGFVQSPSPTLRRAKRTQMSKCFVSPVSSIFQSVGNAFQEHHTSTVKGVIKAPKPLFFFPRPICSGGIKILSGRAFKVSVRGIQLPIVYPTGNVHSVNFMTICFYQVMRFLMYSVDILTSGWHKKKSECHELRMFLFRKVRMKATQ